MTTFLSFGSFNFFVRICKKRPAHSSHTVTRKVKSCFAAKRQCQHRVDFVRKITETAATEKKQQRRNRVNRKTRDDVDIVNERAITPTIIYYIRNAWYIGTLAIQWKWDVFLGFFSRFLLFLLFDVIRFWKKKERKNVNNSLKLQNYNELRTKKKQILCLPLDCRLSCNIHCFFFFVHFYFCLPDDTWFCHAKPNKIK